MNVCVVAFYSAYGDNPLTRLSDLLHIFEPLTEEIFLITGGVPQDMSLNEKVHLTSIEYWSKSRLMPARVLKQLTTQLTISWHLLKSSRHIDLIFWGIGAHVLIIPMILAKLMRKKTILFIAFKSNEVLTREFGAQGFILPQIYKVLEGMSYALCHIIVVNSTELLEQPQLDKHKDKTFPLASPIRFIDTNLFKIVKPLKPRAKRIGYVGRLSEEKGVVNLIKAIPLVLGQQKELEFIIVGDGPQYKEIVEMVEEGNLSSVVKFTGWVSHAELPKHMNEMQLLIIPSLTEGLPTIALEAMACGTPVIATSVGGVPELIRDGETGFILEDNSPQTIAQGIIRVLSYPNLDEVVRNAHTLIEKEYTHEATTERFRKLIASLTNPH